MDNTNNIFFDRGFKQLPVQSKPICKKDLSSCCKMHSFQYIDNSSLQPQFEDDNFNDYAEVRFKNNRKEYFRICHDMGLVCGDIVAVECSPGHDIGVITLLSVLAKQQMKLKGISFHNNDLKKIYRKAKASDIIKWQSTVSNEKSILAKSKKLISYHKVAMKLNDIEAQADGSKVTFYYTAEERVDFRELIKVFAKEFQTRVEMKQIGTRQESARLGGIGSCGRELCCSTWINNFSSVSTQATRTQQIMLNPQKLTGQCTKLKCCLNYEYPVYAEAIKMFPDSNIILKTQKGQCVHVKSDIFKKIMWYSYQNDRSNLFAIDIENVRKIINENKKSRLPEKIEDFAIMSTGNNDNENVVGQEEIKKMGLID